MALGLVVFGLEVATSAVTLTAVRLWTGFSTLFAGDESLVSGSRYLIGIVLAFAGVTLYVVLLWADEAGRRITKDGVVYPNCGTQTKRVRRQRRHRMLARILETNVTSRHCERCGWNGLAT